MVRTTNQIQWIGYGICSDRVAMDNLLLLKDRDVIVRHWFRAWDFGRKYGPYMNIGPSIIHALLAWTGIEPNTRSPPSRRSFN